MKIKPSNFSSTEHDYFSMATLCVFFTCASNFVFVFLRFTTCHRVQKKSKILLFSFLLCRFVTRLVHDKFTVHSKATYYTFWLLSPVLFPFALVYIQDSSHSVCEKHRHEIQFKKYKFDYNLRAIAVMLPFSLP